MQLPSPGLGSACSSRGAAASGPHMKHTRARQRGCCAGALGELGWAPIAQHHHVLSEAQVFPSPAGAPSMSCPRALLTSLRRHPAWVPAPGLAPWSSSYLKPRIRAAQFAQLTRVGQLCLQAPSALLRPSALGLLLTLTASRGRREAARPLGSPDLGAIGQGWFQGPCAVLQLGPTTWGGGNLVLRGP